MLDVNKELKTEIQSIIWKNLEDPIVTDLILTVRIRSYSIVRA